MRARVAGDCAVLLAPAPVAAEWQVRPFIGFTFGGATTFVDPEKATGEQERDHRGLGRMAWRDLRSRRRISGRHRVSFKRMTPRHGESSSLRADSGVKTLTGNVVIALPRRMAGYGLRPYFVGGAG